ncbi:MAG: hypothetical protein M3303_13375 [Gemmatimonadota bacterium]|nr:hypothetical protein [Gemmatimonadota bacterium]
MPLTEHLAIVSLTREVSTRDLLRASAAVQKQIARDFTPYWGLSATVHAFDDLESVPSDYTQIVVFGDADELVGRLEFAIGEEFAAQLIDDFEGDRLSGLHLNAFTRQPFALVSATGDWTVTLSHETLDMIADPFGNRLVAAAHPQDPQQRVNYLVEVCDPCQATWYPVNGVRVSDFYTPKYFDPVWVDRSRYSFTGEITRPLEILEGGYVSWIDPRDSGLYSLAGGESEPVLVADIMQLARTFAPLRTVVDSNPRTPDLTLEPVRPARTAAVGDGAHDAVREASEGAALRTAEAVYSVAAGRG